MKLLRLSSDGRTFEKDSFEPYFAHLDAIRDSLPSPLYSKLRYLEQAYNSGDTFYDAAVVEWRDVLDSGTWKARSEIRILDPYHKREYLFTFHAPEFFAATEQPVSRLGDLHFIEVSRSDEGVYSFCFAKFSSRLEYRVECLEFEYSERDTAS